MVAPPEAKGSVDMDPGAEFFRHGDESGEVVEGAHVEVSGLKDDDGGLGGCADSRAASRKRLCYELALIEVGGQSH